MPIPNNGWFACSKVPPTEADFANGILLGAWMPGGQFRVISTYDPEWAWQRYDAWRLIEKPWEPSSWEHSCEMARKAAI